MAEDKASWQLRRALRLAEKGRGLVEPNPMVGAVIVKNGLRIGEGFHGSFGGAHAEIEALKSCTEDPSGATLYVTLEPCDHQGKTGPCTEAILKAGIAKVVIASKDPLRNGAAFLKENGIEVEIGLLQKEARELNRVFFTFHEKKRPWITLKVAMSLDGKIARDREKQTWLTGEQSKKAVHILRSQHQGILVGAGTILADDPHLGLRGVQGKDPLRIVWKGARALPKKLQIFRDEKHLILEKKTVEEVLQALHEKEIQSVLVEGGQKVFTQFLESGLFDELHCFIAPQILGSDVLPFLDSTQGRSLRLNSVRKLGPDTLLIFELLEPVPKQEFLNA